MAVELTRKSFTPYAAKKGEEYMNAKQRSHFRKILESLKAELSEEIDRTVHTMQDEATVFADPNDRASQESDMALELRNRDRERKLIKKIDETIARIDADEYGYCESCGVEIGLKRLEARPTATLCIDCKTLDEMRERRWPSNTWPSPRKRGSMGPRFRGGDVLNQPCFAAFGCAPTAFIDRRTLPLSSASSTLTFTVWPSLRWSDTALTRSWLICEMCSRPSRPGSSCTIAPKSSRRSTVPS